MTRPSWERKTAEREAETRDLLKKQGERESLQQSDNLLYGDYLGLEDGRPGIGVVPGIGEWAVTMPMQWRIVLWAVMFVAVIIMALGTRACIGEERAREILNEQRAGSVHDQGTGNRGGNVAE